MLRVLTGIVVATLVLPMSTAAQTSAATQALAWTPPGPVSLLIAFRAGGGADTQARLIAEALESRHGWTVVPENVAGKGGALMARKLKSRPADGTVLGMAVTETLGYSALASPRAGYSAGDFTPVTTTAQFQMGIVALSKRGWKTLDDVFAAARGGQQIAFGAMSPALADISYVLGKANGVQFRIVSGLRGGKAVLNALTAGDIDIGWGAGIQNRAVRSGEMVNLASGLSTPLQISPDAPLLTRYGVDYTADGYFVVVAPAGLPEPARTTIASAISDIVHDPETKAAKFIRRALGGPVTVSGEELDRFMVRHLELSTRLLKEASQ